MKQHERRLVLVVGGSVLTVLGVLVAACSDDAVQPLPGGDTFTNPDSGNASSSSGGGPTNPSDDDDDVTGPVDSGTADCSAAPKLHPTTNGFYCAFFKDGGPDSGSADNCGNDETCCNPGKNGSSYPLSYCAIGDKGDNGNADCMQGATDQGLTWVIGTPPTQATTWECGGSTNCGGQKCCAFSVAGADAGNYVNMGKDTTSTAPAACKPQYVYQIGGAKCADDCDPTSELELCSSTDGCSDTTANCIAATTAGYRDVGVCVKPKSH